MGAAQSQLTVYRSTASAPGQRIIAVLNGAKDVKLRRRGKTEYRKQRRTGTMMWGIKKQESQDISQMPWVLTLRRGSPQSQHTCQPESLTYHGAMWLWSQDNMPPPVSFICCKTGNPQVAQLPKHNVESRGGVCLHRCRASLEYNSL